MALGDLEINIIAPPYSSADLYLYAHVLQLLQPSETYSKRVLVVELQFCWSV